MFRVVVKPTPKLKRLRCGVLAERVNMLTAQV